jgi:hypothetical protein
MIRRLAVIALLLVPAISLAQRGGRTQADRKTPLFDKEEAPKGPTLRVRDIEDQSPLKLLIDKKKDLKLSDAQVSELKDAESKLKDVNAPLYKAVDSLIRDIKNGSASPNDQAKEKLRGARVGLMDVLKELNKNYETPLNAVLERSARLFVRLRRARAADLKRRALAAGLCGRRTQQQRRAALPLALPVRPRHPASLSDRSDARTRR